jgi:hypothetical protein
VIGTKTGIALIYFLKMRTAGSSQKSGTAQHWFIPTLYQYKYQVYTYHIPGKRPIPILAMYENIFMGEILSLGEKF